MCFSSNTRELARRYITVKVEHSRVVIAVGAVTANKQNDWIRSDAPHGHVRMETAIRLQRLRAVERQILYMRYMEGRSREETARALGCGVADITAMEIRSRRSLGCVFARH